jgi:transcriptional regulator with XRE-family HTH domain
MPVAGDAPEVARIPFDLRTARLNRGLTLRQAAEVIGVPTMVLSRAERGTRPHPGNAKAIADFYGRRVSDVWADGPAG